MHSRQVYGAEGLCVAYLANTLTHTQQTDTGSSVRQRLRATTTNRQRSKLAEGSQEGEKGREKWVSRPREGEVKKNFGEKNLSRQE